MKAHRSNGLQGPKRVNQSIEAINQSEMNGHHPWSIDGWMDGYTSSFDQFLILQRFAEWMNKRTYRCRARATPRTWIRWSSLPCKSEREWETRCLIDSVVVWMADIKVRFLEKWRFLSKQAALKKTSAQSINQSINQRAINQSDIHGHPWYIDGLFSRL